MDLNRQQRPACPLKAGGNVRGEKAMTIRDDRATTDRRGFLKFAGLGSLAGAVALATKGGEAEAADVSPQQGLGYRETQHVRTFYESTRF
jgi:hypothetical protein